MFTLTEPVGGGGVPGTIDTSLQISSGSTVVVDVCESEDLSVKWLLALVNQNEQVVATTEVMASHKFGTNPTHNQYGMTGDKINYDLDVQLQGDSLTLLITNNEPFEVLVNVVRIQLLAVN